MPVVVDATDGTNTTVVPIVVVVVAASTIIAAGGITANGSFGDCNSFGHKHQSSLLRSTATSRCRHILSLFFAVTIITIIFFFFVVFFIAIIATTIIIILQFWPFGCWRERIVVEMRGDRNRFATIFHPIFINKKKKKHDNSDMLFVE